MRGQKRIMPRAAAIGIVYVFIFGSIGIASYILIPRLGNQITEFVTQAPNYLTSAKGRAQKLNEVYQAYNLPEPVRKKASEWLASFIGTVGVYTTDGIGNFLLGLITLLPWLILIPIIAFFLLKDADSFRRSALAMLPSGRWRWRGDEFFQDVNRTLAAYIRAHLIACLFIGTVCTIAFLIIGVPYALLFGIIAALLEFIPLVGPLTVVAIVTPITGFYSIRQAMVVLIFLAVFRLIHDYIIYPRIIGQGIHLHPLAVILAILCGAELAGIAGIFLAIPVVAITTVTYRHWLEHRGSSGLVADLLKPESAAAIRTEMQAEALEIAPVQETPDDDERMRPTFSTTPEEMERLRPDLTSGELKMPKLD
jgi:predicted PurR-regulated permease PerM